MGIDRKHSMKTVHVQLVFCALSVGIEISGDFLPVILNAIKNMGEQNFFAWKKRENGND